MTFKDSLENILSEVARSGWHKKGTDSYLEIVDKALASILALIESSLPSKGENQEVSEYWSGWNDCLSEMRKKMEGK